MMEQTSEPFYHVLDTACSTAFSASLDRLSDGNGADCSFYGSEHEATTLSPQSPQLGRSVPMLSSPEDGKEIILGGKIAGNVKTEDIAEQCDKPNNKHSSQSSVYYAQIIYEEYEKMKKDTPTENNGTCRRVPLMINPVPSSKSKKHSSSNTSGGSNTSVHTSGSNSSLRVFKRASSGQGGTGHYSDTMENGSGGGIHSSPPNSGGSSADQYEIQSGLNLPPQAIKTLPAPHHRPSKSHTTTFGGHHSIGGFHQHQHSSQFHPDFGTLSSRPVLPPPPPPPVPPISHIPSASVVVENTSHVSSFPHHPRTQSFTLKDRPLPQRPDTSTMQALGFHGHQTAYIPRSVTPEPSRRRTKKPPQAQSAYNVDNNAARHFKTLPNNRKVNRDNCMNINWNPDSNFSTPARGKRKHSVPNEKILQLENDKNVDDVFEDEVNPGNNANRVSRQQPQTPSKLSSTFSTIKRLLKRDKTPSRGDAISRHNKSASQSPAMHRGEMTLSVFRNSNNNFESDDLGSSIDELAYDIQSLPLEQTKAKGLSKLTTASENSSNSELAATKARNLRDSTKPLYISTTQHSTGGTLNRTQSLVEMSSECGTQPRTSKNIPRRPVRIISFLSQASDSQTSPDELSSYASSLSSSNATTPVQYVNTLFGSPTDTSHEIIDFLSNQNSYVLNSFLSNYNPYLVSDMGDFKPLLEFSTQSQVSTRLCAMFLFDILSQISHKFYEPTLSGIGPHMFYVFCPFKSYSSSNSLQLSRPRLILRWDAPLPNSKKYLVKPEPSKVAELLAIIVYVSSFRSISTSLPSIVQHVKSSVLVDNFFKVLISNESFFTCSTPTLVQCFISCYLGWLPATFSNMFVDCSKAIPSCNFNPNSLEGANHLNSNYNSSTNPIINSSSAASSAEKIVQQIMGGQAPSNQNQHLTISTAQLWIRLEKAKLSNQIFAKLFSQSLSSPATPTTTPTPNGDSGFEFMLDELHDKSSILCTCNECDISSAVKMWMASSEKKNSHML